MSIVVLTDIAILLTPDFFLIKFLIQICIKNEFIHYVVKKYLNAFSQQTDLLQLLQFITNSPTVFIRERSNKLYHVQE